MRRGSMAAGMLVALLPGCGGDSVSAPPPPPAPVTELIVQGSFSGVTPGGGVALAPFSTSRMGTLRITVDWTFASNNMDVALVRAPCDPPQFLALTCAIVGVSESPTAKPEILTLPNTVSATYRLFVSNRGTTDESISYRV